jgi:uncharacterized protein
MTVPEIDLLAARLLDGAPCLQTIPGTSVGPSPTHGRGLFATQGRPKGDILGELDGQVVPVVQYPKVEALEWNGLTPELLLVRPIRTSYGFMNHSTTPNVVIEDGRTMRACRPIEPGDELLIDYFATPVPDGYLATAEAAALRQRA